jgi:hypothetical protein
MRGLLPILAATVLLTGCSKATPLGDAGAGPSTADSPAAAAASAATGALSPAPTPSTTATHTMASPAHFGTLPPGARLPSGSQCAAWVRARPVPENKRVNQRYNQTTGHQVPASMLLGGLARRIDGQFTGTTAEILRWAACKWGVDEDLVRAQAAIESWWRQTTLGDFGADPTACPPGHGLGVDGTAGQCPQSYGIMQDRYPYMKDAFPGAMRSTAMNADVAYAIWRTCFEGYETWLNTVERGRRYAAGDAWGCVGRWFSGRWYTAAGEQYVTRVRGYLDQRIWATPDFQER